MLEQLMNQAQLISQGQSAGGVEASPEDATLFEEFAGAVMHVTGKRAAAEFPEAVLRRLYGLFMIAEKGPPPRMPPQGMEEEQHRAWVETYSHFGAEAMRSSRDVMREYIELVEAADPSFLFDDEDEVASSDAGLPTAPPAAPKPANISVFDAARDGLDLSAFLPAHANDVDGDGLSVLHVAVDAEQAAAVEALLEAKARPDAVDAQGATALHYAALLGSEPLAKLLLGAGADPGVRDEDGKTAATLAQTEGHAQLAKVLLLALVEPARAEGLLPGRLPTVDMNDWLHGGSKAREAISSAFDQAFQQFGFCNVRGFEELLPQAVIDEARKQAKGFFALPLEEKRRLAHVDGVVGYLGPGDETVSESAGSGANAAQPDPVESLNLPAYQEEGHNWRAAEAEAECPWKAAPYLPTSPAGLPAAALAYFAGATRLMAELMELMESALNLPPHHMHKPFEKPGTLLRFAYYPPVGRKAGAKPAGKGSAKAAAKGSAKAASKAGTPANPALRYGEHTDYDGFTILQREGDEGGDNGGLEIEMPDGTWAQVPALAGMLTINIGDLFARWTNDRWRAAKHRVSMPKPSAKPASEGRLSLVYFTGPHPDTLVTCLPSTKCRRQPPQYEPIKAGEHVQMKMLAATATARATKESGTLV